MRNTTHMNKYIIYTRVSTTRQGESGLGLEAQLQGCMEYIREKNGHFLQEYTEVGSAWKGKRRPQLEEALRHAKEANATLLVWMLDRLTRRVSEFDDIICKNGVKVAVATNPDADDYALMQIMMFSENESKVKSQRAKDSYKIRRQRNPDAVFGCGTMDKVKAMSEGRREAAISNPNSRRAAAVVSTMVKEGKSLTAIAARLNQFEFPTPNGGLKWYASSVKNLISKLITQP